MIAIDRRTMLRTALSGAAFVAAGGVFVAAAPELAEAVPLAADKVAPIETEDHFEEDHLKEDHFEDEGHVEQIQYWRRGSRWGEPRWRTRARGREGRRTCRRWAGGGGGVRVC